MTDAAALPAAKSIGVTRSRRIIPAPMLFLVLTGGALAAGAAVAVEPLIAVGVVIALIYALVVLERPLLGVYACYALVPATAGLRRGLPIPYLKFSDARSRPPSFSCFSTGSAMWPRSRTGSAGPL
jgi:hypothetical protein